VSVLSRFISIAGHFSLARSVMVGPVPGAQVRFVPTCLGPGIAVARANESETRAACLLDGWTIDGETIERFQ